MTDDASAPSEAAEHGAPLLPPPAPDAAGAPVEPASAVLFVRAPRAGELTPRWRLVQGVTWICVAVAIGSIWKTTDQLGMSTWWLGPRGEPRPAAVQVLPFAPALVMILMAINHVRHLAWWSLGASALMVAVGVVDLGYKPAIGVLEIAVGAAATLVSLASFVGSYRPIDAAPATA